MVKPKKPAANASSSFGHVQGSPFMLEHFAPSDSDSRKPSETFGTVTVN
jgi:hypothetical protein